MVWEGKRASISSCYESISSEAYTDSTEILEESESGDEY